MAQDADFAVITHTNFSSNDATADLNISRLLQPRRHYKRLPPLDLQKFEVAALSQYVQSASSGQNHTIIAPGATVLDLRTLLAFAEAEFPTPVRLACRILRLDTLDALDKAELANLAEACRERRLFLFTETEEMKALVQARYGVAVEGAMVLPCMVDPDTGLNLDLEPQKEFWSVAFFGSPRDEKGSEFHPRILRGLRRAAMKHPPHKPIHVYAQGHRLSKLHAAKISHNISLTKERMINRILSSRISIETELNPIPDERFAMQLSDADLLVLPYKVPPYDTAGSGLVLDAVLAGKLILHSAGMAMNEFLNCGNAQSARTADEFSNQIISMLSQIDKYSAAKAEARKRVMLALEKTKTEVRTLLET